MKPEAILNLKGIYVNEDEFLGAGNQGMTFMGELLDPIHGKTKVAIKRFHTPQPWEDKVQQLFSGQSSVLPLGYHMDFECLPPEVAAALTHKLLWSKEFLDQYIVSPIALVKDQNYITTSNISLASELVDGITMNNVNTYELDLDKQSTLLYGLSNIVTGLAISKVNGLQHKDVKPANIIVDQDGSPRLLDFGYSAEDETGKNVGGSPLHTCPEYIVESVNGICLTVDTYGMMRVLVEATLPKEFLSQSDSNYMWRRTHAESNSLVTDDERKLFSQDVLMVLKASRIQAHDNDLYRDYESDLKARLLSYYQENLMAAPKNLEAKIAVMGRIARTELTRDKNMRFADPHIAMIIFIDIWKELLGHKEIYGDRPYEYGRMMVDQTYMSPSQALHQDPVYLKRLNRVRAKYNPITLADRRTMTAELRKRAKGSLDEGIYYSFSAFGIREDSDTQAIKTQVIQLPPVTAAGD